MSQWLSCGSHEEWGDEVLSFYLDYLVTETKAFFDSKTETGASLLICLNERSWKTY